MHDINPDADAAATYECLACGELVKSHSNPLDCPSCETVGAFQRTGNSLE